MVAETNRIDEQAVNDKRNKCVEEGKPQPVFQKDTFDRWFAPDTQKQGQKIPLANAIDIIMSIGQLAGFSGTRLEAAAEAGARPDGITEQSAMVVSKATTPSQLAFELKLISILRSQEFTHQYTEADAKALSDAQKARDSEGNKPAIADSLAAKVGKFVENAITNTPENERDDVSKFILNYFRQREQARHDTQQAQQPGEQPLKGPMRFTTGGVTSNPVVGTPTEVQPQKDEGPPKPSR